MRTLIVEDDFVSRLMLQEFLKELGPSHIAIHGAEAVDAYCTALDQGMGYDLICLDIMMPEMDGQTALRKIRTEEERRAIPPKYAAKVIMTTALQDPLNVMRSFHELCDGYLVKPFDRRQLLDEIHKLGLGQSE